MPPSPLLIVLNNLSFGKIKKKKKRVSPRGYDVTV